jgi:hypothetical protein
VDHRAPRHPRGCRAHLRLRIRLRRMAAASVPLRRPPVPRLHREQRPTLALAPHPPCRAGAAVPAGSGQRVTGTSVEPHRGEAS